MNVLNCIYFPEPSVTGFGTSHCGYFYHSFHTCDVIRNLLSELLNADCIKERHEVLPNRQNQLEIPKIALDLKILRRTVVLSVAFLAFSGLRLKIHAKPNRVTEVWFIEGQFLGTVLENYEQLHFKRPLQS